MTIESTKQSAASRRRGRLVGGACLLLLASCGGGSSVSVGVPSDNNGPVIAGRVSMPNGEVAAAPSALQRLAEALLTRVEALVSGNVVPVGGGVEVRLVEIGEGNVVNGQIRGGHILFHATTNSDGVYSVRLPTGTTPDTCRFFLEVGSSTDRTLTRAFVYDQVPSSVDIDFQSEAAVRLILDQIKARTTNLCNLDANEIRSITNAVRASGNQVFGDTAGAVNSSAVVAAGADPGVQSAIAIAVGGVTPAPTSTRTVPPTATTTITATATATQVLPTPTGVPPTATRTVPARTNTPVPTATAPPPTRTATATDTAQPPTATNTPVATNTVTPSATNTTVPTNTTTPTNTNTTTAVPSSTPQSTSTATAVRTNTATPTVTNTAPPTPTATRAVPQVNLGVVAGTAGTVVSVPVALVANGAQIAAVSNDIDYDAALVDAAQAGGQPDCSVDARLAGVKDVHARVSALEGTRKRLRVGLIGAANNDPISSGPLYTCRFVIAGSANGSVPLLNTPDAAGRQAETVAVEGSAGRIDVAAASAALALSVGTAAPGGQAVVTASLSARGQVLAAASTDIHFDTGQLSVAEKDGEPDCTADPAVAALDKEVVARELPDGTGKAVLRVGLIGRDNDTALPDADGTALFQCRFAVQAGSGSTITLEHSPEGAARNAQPVGLTSQPGSITVQ